MNILKATITSIQTNGSLSLVSLDAGDCHLKSIVIETPETADYLIEGKEILVHFKETIVIIGKGNEFKISLQNRLPGHISSIEPGALLSRIHISTPAGEVVSIITSAAVSQLDLKVGDQVTALVKTNEIMLSP